MAQSDYINMTLEELKSNATEVKKYSYTRKLHPEEIAALKTEVSDKLIEISELNAVLKEAKATHKEAVKKLGITSQLQKIKYKKIDCTEDCFFMHDYENQRVEIVNSEGTLIDSRPMNAEERQEFIKFPKAINE